MITTKACSGLREEAGADQQECNGNATTFHGCKAWKAPKSNQETARRAYVSNETRIVAQEG
jgi:hypothetical protein